MKIIATALLAGASLLLFPGPGAAQDALDDALAMIERDPAQALLALEPLVENGSPEAANAVAVIISRPPEGVPQDEARALRLWEQAVAGGSDPARLNLGTYLLMNDDPADDSRAVSTLRAISDERLIPFAAWPLGRAMLFGEGVHQDLLQGVRLLETAVEVSPNNADARFLLGRAYQNGWGVPINPDAAYRHLKIAADEGDPRAQWNVGMMLLNGDGVAEDPALAHQYVRASAENGLVDGMISMAVMLASGEGTQPDPSRARAWYLRAAEAGSAHALRGLGAMLVVGEGGPADALTGAAYLELAEQGGDEMAGALQQRFASQIGAEDPAAIEAVKSQWLARHGVPR